MRKRSERGFVAFGVFIIGYSLMSIVAVFAMHKHDPLEEMQYLPPYVQEEVSTPKEMTEEEHILFQMPDNPEVPKIHKRPRIGDFE